MGLILRFIVTCLFVTYALGLLDFNFPKKKPCIMAQMNVNFKLLYKNETSNLSDPLVNTETSKCSMNGSTATLALHWTNSNDTMTFTFMRGTKKVEMSVMYEFTPLEHFKDSDNSNLIVMVSPKKELSMNNMSYKCDSSQNIGFNKSMYELVMSVAKVQVQAFGVENGNFSAFEECSEDTVTTTEMTTTSPRPPTQFLYKFPMTDKACILLDAAIQVDINYTNTKNATATAVQNIPDPSLTFGTVKITGNCAGSEYIKLTWNDQLSEFSLRMDFMPDKDGVRLKTMEVIANLSSGTYPLLHNKSVTVKGKKSMDLFLSSNDSYFFCNSHQEETLDNIKVVIYKIKVQAFGVKNSTFTGDGTECSQDLSTENPSTATTPTETTANTTNTTATMTTSNGTTNTTPTTNTTATMTSDGTTNTAPLTNTTATMTTSNGTTATSAPISTTAIIPHPTNKYSVGDGNVTCVYLVARMDFTFPYTTMNGTNNSVVISVPQNFETNGTCSKQNQTINVLNIYFYNNNWKLEFVFEPDNSTSQLGDMQFKTYSVKSITLDYKMDPALFPGYNGSDNTTHSAKANITTSLFQSKVNGSYKCNADYEVDFTGNIKLETYNLQYKAFNQDNSTNFGGDLTECSGDNSNDNKTNSVVPIAVGAALAGLVVIVLIAYLIGRRRNRKGYESV